MKFCIIHQFCFDSLTLNVYDTPNFKKAIDKSLTKVYNGIVNSKGAADDKSAALFLVYSANSIHEGVYEVSGLLRPFILYASHNNGV